MLLINCSKIKIIADLLDDKEYEGIKFKIVAQEGLILTVYHNAPNDDTAKKVVYKLLKKDPKFTNIFLNIRFVDEIGKII